MENCAASYCLSQRNTTCNPTKVIICFNDTSNNTDDYIAENVEILSHIYIIFLKLLCFLAMIVNIKVFSCVYWIRRPFPPTLKFSLSLAFADFFASFSCAASLFFGDLFRFEILRLSLILITVMHLLALSLNHFVGIKRPLHYNYLVTPKKMYIILIMTWVFPSVYVISIYTFEATSNFWFNVFYGCLDSFDINFTNTFRFRMLFSAFIVISMVLMTIFYLCILVIVRKQQNVWRAMSRCGSQRWRHCGSNRIQSEQKQLKGNLKAIYTTLIILGSCFFGWIPAILMFVLMCQDCMIDDAAIKEMHCNYQVLGISLRLFDNSLLFMKMMANPIIYSIRIKEIQDATRKMHSAIKAIFRHQRTSNNSSSIPVSRTSNVRMSMRSINENTIIRRVESDNNTLL